MFILIIRIEAHDERERVFYYDRRNTNLYTLFGRGESVLFLHGNGGNSHFFKYQVPDFKSCFRLIFLDSRAHGKSTNHGEKLDFTLMAKDTKEALDALGIEKTAIVGFSDGANLAMAFAALYPEAVSKLVLNSGNLFSAARN